MQALGFYIIYPILYLISLLPFRILYILSDILCFILRDIVGYRKEVILTNFKNSFPEKTPQEINFLYRKYYSYLVDLILETLKTLTLSEQEAKKRSVFKNTDWLDAYYNEGRSIIIVLGHYGNWEYGGPGFSLAAKHPLTVVYRPLTNKYFENMMYKMRTKFGTKITPMNNTLKDMISRKNSPTATAFVADQAAVPETAYWTNFLNQDTAFFTGPEKLAKKFNYPVVYMNFSRPKRGYYIITPELMFDSPKDSAENEILEAFAKRLEKDILAEPTPWLWSHKRWKHKRVVK